MKLNEKGESMKHRTFCYLMGVCLLCAACADDDASDTPKKEGNTDGVAYCDVTKNWDSGYAALEAALIDLVNEKRSQGASCGDAGTFGSASPLTPHAGLECAARVHSKDMADRNFFSHDNPDGDGPDVRMSAADVELSYWGENIAAGSATAEDAVAQWMDSDGHCANFMNPDFTHIGVGYYPGGNYGHLWTATLMASR